MKTTLFAYSLAFVSASTTAQNWASYTTQNTALPSNAITAVCPTDRGFIAGTDQGLARFDGRSWQMFDKSNSMLPGNVVRHIANMGQGEYWAATNKGILCMTESADDWSTIIPSNSGLPHEAVTSILRLPSSDIYIGTWGGGLARLANNTWTVYNSTNSPMPSDGVNDLFLDQFNRLWISTFNGLACFNGWQWEVFTTANSPLPHNDVRFVRQDRSGALVVGTADGFARFSLEGNWQVYNASTLGYSIHLVNQATTDADGTMRLATDAGLLKLSADGQVTRITASANGLPINSLNAISTDDLGNLIIGTAGAGVVVYNPNGIVAGIGSTQQRIGDVSIYPNPAVGTVNFDIELKAVSDLAIKLIDMTGRQVRTVVPNSMPGLRFTGSIDTQGLLPGTYTVVLHTSFGRETARLVVL